MWVVYPCAQGDSEDESRAQPDSASSVWLKVQRAEPQPSTEPWSPQPFMRVSGGDLSAVEAMLSRIAEKAETTDTSLSVDNAARESAGV